MLAAFLKWVNTKRSVYFIVTEKHSPVFGAPKGRLAIALIQTHEFLQSYQNGVLLGFEVWVFVTEVLWGQPYSCVSLLNLLNLSLRNWLAVIKGTVEKPLARKRQWSLIKSTRKSSRVGMSFWKSKTNYSELQVQPRWDKYSE